MRLILLIDDLQRMKHFSSLVLFICGLFVISQLHATPSYTDASKRTRGLSNTSYYINPVSGDDLNSGLDENQAWKSFMPANQIAFSEGCKIYVMEEGDLHYSMHLVAKGTKKSPVEVHFAKGQYNFFPAEALKKKFHISNTNDSPDSLKSVAFYLQNSQHIKVLGNESEIIFRGKVIEMAIDQCQDVDIEGISFDYKRPTVSEFTVLNVDENSADVRIHSDSKFKIENKQLIWLGEAWQHVAQSYGQVFNPDEETLQRKSLPVKQLSFSDLGDHLVRIHFESNPGFQKGLVFQNRNVFRDYCGFFTRHSKDIRWKNVNVYFMHGMGFVSQFSENISFNNVKVEPRTNSGRTCAAWADILHFSGCKGKLEVRDCILSAANDDAVNVHGTHLRIVEQVSKNIINVRFVHPQTYGFDPFFVDDKIEFIRAKNLLPYGRNKIKSVRKLNEKDYQLSLHNPLPKNIEKDDVIENVSWTSNVSITGTTVKHIPTRGILISTRGKVLVENNTFFKTVMSGILIANDANYWFESGYVRDVQITNNVFKLCGEPVIYIHPEVLELNDAVKVHKNIQIKGNQFTLKGRELLSAQSTEKLNITNNQIELKESATIEKLCKLKSCKDVQISNNKITQHLDSCP